MCEWSAGKFVECVVYTWVDKCLLFQYHTLVGRRRRKVALLSVMKSPKAQTVDARMVLTHTTHYACAKSAANWRAVGCVVVGTALMLCWVTLCPPENNIYDYLALMLVVSLQCENVTGYTLTRVNYFPFHKHVLRYSILMLYWIVLHQLQRL